MLIIIGAIVFSLFAIVIVGCVMIRKMPRIGIAYAVLLELVVIATVLFDQPAYFGFSGIPALLMILNAKKRDI